MGREGRHAPWTGFFGIDMWHAVEFSRSGCAPVRARSAGRCRGNSPTLPTAQHPGQIALRARSTGVIVVDSLALAKPALSGIRCPGLSRRKFNYTPIQGGGQIQIRPAGVTSVTPLSGPPPRSCGLDAGPGTGLPATLPSPVGIPRPRLSHCSHTPHPHQPFASRRLDWRLVPCS